jgi:hypothetical protein
VAVDFQATDTEQPQNNVLRRGTNAPELSDDDWESIGQDLYNGWVATTSARKDYDENLRAWSALYEMAVDQQDWPWEDAANLVLPIVPSEVDAMHAYVAAQVFVQRLVIITAADGDEIAAQLAPRLEKFVNAELQRPRSDGKTPIQTFLTMLKLGLIDGAAPCDVLFTERIEPKIIVHDAPIFDEDGEPETLPGGLPKTKRVVTQVRETVAEANFIPRKMKEWYLSPAESPSIASALAQDTVLWMTEKDMREKPYFNQEKVDEVLDWVVAGMTDVSSDPLGDYDKTVGGQIQTGQGQGTLTSRFFVNRGPAQIIRRFSEQFDMNGDGIPERNIFWFYGKMPKMIGWTPYEYIASEWPTFCFAPFERPLQVPGYSLVERLADLAAEASSGRNQRRNYIDLCLMPLMLQREGDLVRDKDGAFFPGARWTVEDVDKSLKWYAPPALSPDSFSDEARIDVYVSKVSGQNAPAVGAQSSGRRSATESRQQQLAQTIRANLVAMEFRLFLRQIIQFWWKLNVQYYGAALSGPSTDVPDALAKHYGGDSARGGTMTLDPEIFSHSFNINISGLSDPTDAGARRQEIMGAVGVIGKAFPWILQDPEKSYALAEAFMETFQWAGIERFIGTAQDAKQRKEQMAQQQAAMAAQGGAPGQPSPGGKPAPSAPTPTPEGGA